MCPVPAALRASHALPSFDVSILPLCGPDHKPFRVTLLQRLRLRVRLDHAEQLVPLVVTRVALTLQRVRGSRGRTLGGVILCERSFHPLMAEVDHVRMAVAVPPRTPAFVRL